jgi:hypothetical protein
LIATWLAVLIAAIAGVGLAALAAFGVINAASNSSGTGQIDSPLVVYGSR